MRAHVITPVLSAALLFASLGNHSLAVNQDADYDGMADSWEVFYFGHTSNCLASVDSDLDGHNNFQEFICGTDPTNNASSFKVAALTFIHGSTNHLILNWNSTSNRVYNVLWTSNLTNGFQRLATDISYPGNSYTDTAHPAETAGFYCVDVQYDFASIHQCWLILQDMYAWSRPSGTEITNWFSDWVADGYVDEGSTAVEERDNWTAGDGPGVGIKLSVEDVGPYDVSGTSYVEGREVKVSYSWSTETGSFPTTMVFDGTNWLWYGDQRWLDTDIAPYARMEVDSYGSASFYTGLDLYLWDDSLYAYNHGARSAIVTGPGLPAEGQVLEHYYPQTSFGLYPQGGWPYPSGGGGLWLDDSVIASIPENAQYTIRLYAETADVVSLSDTPLATYTRNIPKPPILNANLDASYFPTLSFPASHDGSAINIPGMVEISWTNPTYYAVSYVSLGLSSGDWLSTDFWTGQTSITFDATKYSSDITAGSLYIQGDDQYERLFGMGWDLY